MIAHVHGLGTPITKGPRPMELYFSPLACSMACRIALDEAGAQATFIEVDHHTHRTGAGEALEAVSPLAQVPVLRTDSGELLTENAAVLQYIAARYPEAMLVAPQEAAKARLHEWLSFIGTELHKSIFNPLFDRHAPPAVKAYALTKAAARLDVLAKRLEARGEAEYVLGAFSIADCYLVTVLNWAQATPVDLTKWPAIKAYLTVALARPSVARAIAIELPLYLAEKKRAADS